MKYDSSPLVARMMLFGLAAFLISIFIGIAIHYSHQASLLHSTGIKTKGVIIGTYCLDHGSLRFSYLVGGKTYINKEACILPCDNAIIGNTVEVVFAPSEPKLSTCNALLLSEKFEYTNYILIAFISLMIGVGIVRMTALDSPTDDKSPHSR
jgi:hypothetical protein